MRRARMYRLLARRLSATDVSGSGEYFIQHVASVLPRNRKRQLLGLVTDEDNYRLNGESEEKELHGSGEKETKKTERDTEQKVS